MIPPLPQISIVMPVFNHADLVIEMMASIRANTFAEWELIAIDDGSAESDFQTIMAYAAQDERIHYQRRNREPKGAPACRNIGFEMAHGQYVIFWDSDDWVTPDCLRERFAAIEKHPQLDFMVFPAGVYRSGHMCFEPCSALFGYPVYADDVAAFCSRNLPFVVWNNIYRRSSLQAKGVRWDERLLSLQDAAFNMSALVADMKYDYASTSADYAYRLSSSGSISKQIGNVEHYRSNVLATRIAYELVQGRFGHRYDRQLYLGALYVYVKMARVCFDDTFARDLAQCIALYSPSYGRWFALQMRVTRLLMHVMPYKLARQLPMAFSLLRRWSIEEIWLPHWHKNV